MGVYAKSPYLKGVFLWRTLSDDTQAIIDRHAFKNSIKKDRAKFLLDKLHNTCSLLSIC